MSTRSRALAFRSLLSVALSLIGLSVLAMGLVVWLLRSDEIESAARESQHIATLLAKQMDRSVRAVDEIVSEIQHHVAAFGIRTAADFSRVASDEDIDRLLQDQRARLPQAVIIALVSSDGGLVKISGEWMEAQTGFSNSDSLQHFRTQNDPELYVSMPAQKGATHAPLLFFSKRINSVDGTFAGYVGIGVRVEYFRHIYEPLSLLHGRSFLCLRKDGMIILNYPEENEHAGQTLPSDSPWYQTVAQGGGHYRALDYHARQAQVVAVRPLSNYPLIVNVAASESAILANWQQRAAAIGVSTLVAVLCSVFLLKALVSQFQRLLRSQASIAEREARLTEKSQELEKLNQRLSATLNNMHQGVCMFNRAGRLVVCNERYLRMYKLPPDAVRPGITLRALLALKKTVGTFSDDPDTYAAELCAQLAQGKYPYFIKHLDDGRAIATNHQCTADGGWVETHEDITERQQAEARIAHMARHDPLTDLANRSQLREKMDEAHDRLLQCGHGFALFVLDLDLFKSVNDTLGHPVGDALLKAVAQRLRACLPPHYTAARLGGDEFAILQPDDGDRKENAIRLANQLLNELTAPYEIEGHQIVIGLSMGIALSPEHGAEPDQLLKKADLALYRAKSDGRNSYRFYERDMDAAQQLRRTLDIDLRNALARCELELHYQPIIDVTTQEVCAAEALVRWRHPRHGQLSPDRFISLAEETGLIIPIGEWILRQACADAARWPNHVKVAVNLSCVQFRNANLLGIVTSAIADSGLMPDRLELEITESVLLQKHADNLTLLYQLKSLGVAIVLDDFGTGYSSLSYLRMFPFDKIKIDKLFVAELCNRADCAAIVCAVAGLGHNLNIKTTAEGVETQEQFDLLRAAGCTQVQGYLFAPPLPAAELAFERVTDRYRRGHIA